MPKKNRIWTVKKYVLYNFDRDCLATRKVFANHRDAADVAQALHNVVVVPLVLEAVTAGSPRHAA
jgi:hypothetical protein